MNRKRAYNRNKQNSTILMIGNKDIEEARAFGLTHAEFIAREYLKFRDGRQTSMNDIAYALGINRRNAERVIASMIKKESITRTGEKQHGGCLYIIAHPSKMTPVKNDTRQNRRVTPVKNDGSIYKEIKENIIIDDIKTQACAHEKTIFDLVFEWCYSSKQDKDLLFYRNGLIAGNETEEEKKTIVRANTDEFTNIQLENGIDIEREGCRDTRIHFANWIRKCKKIKEDESATINRTSNARKRNEGISTDRAAAIVAAGRELANITERMRKG